ncbi:MULTISPECIES: hypothetical protein [Halorussus]|uniref:hypothetical protein n=1 Tax=Halorussus TaxID=1070314 RepID=UPI0020A04023|nr:hypothetical protein [Halorussus vallis]USZ74960.1 hypothetical protein NGM07_16160 [Halorussus vallis]
MTLHIRDTLADGISRVTTRNGAVLLAVYLGAILLQTGFVLAATTTYLPLSSGGVPVAGVESTGPAPGTQLPTLVSFPAALIATMTGGLLTVPVYVVATRTLVGEYAERIPDGAVVHRLGRAMANRLVGVWVVSLAVLAVSLACLYVGFSALFAVVGEPIRLWLFTTRAGQASLAVLGLGLLSPAAALGASLLFVGQEISVRDKSVGDALVGSWRLTRRNRVRLFVLFAIPVAPSLLLSVAASAFLSPVLAQLVALVGSAVASVFAIGIMAPAYVRIADIDRETLPYASR